MANSATNEFQIRFEEVNPARANKEALELKQMLESVAGSEASVSIQKDNEETMDLGGTLVILFGTPAAIAIAKGIHQFIAKWGSRVVIETPDGKVIATGDAAANIDVAKTAEALLGAKR